jgi:hypothetical protein
MQKQTLITLAVVMTISFISACGGSTPAPTEEPAEEPAAVTGDTLLQERCTGCHGLDRVEQAQKSQEEWEENVSRMVDKGAELNQEEQAILVEYLAETYGP